MSMRLMGVIGQLLCRILGSKFLLEFLPFSFYLGYEVVQTKEIYSEFIISEMDFYGNNYDDFRCYKEEL